jgi:hypothetical protein
MSDPLDRDALDPEALDRRIDASLRRAFAPPPAGDLVWSLPAPAAVPARRRLSRISLAVAAAALLCVTLVFAWRTRSDGTQPTPDGVLPAMWVAAYHDAVARGFDTKNCCDGDCNLKTRCRELFAAALDLADGTDIEVCGAYCGPAGGAAAMLARAGDEPLCVFVLPRERARNVRTGDFDGLRIHRRDVGQLVVFEVSRLRAARVLPHLYVPEG